MKKHYTVSLIQEYPIYEPAEGGYYYSGQEVKSEKTRTRKEARAILEDIAKAFDIDIISPDYAANTSKYIGEDAYIKITKKYHPKNSGYHPYC